MEDNAKMPEHGALLVADIGLDETNVTLIDVVDDMYRLVARASSPSTYGPPDSDPTLAIRSALRDIERITSRELLHGDDLIYPQDEAGNGVDGVVASTSAAGALSVAVAGVSSQASVRSALHAARATYTTVLDTVALDEGGAQLGKHVVGLAQSEPDVIVFAGGVENSKVPATQRLAHLVGMLAQHMAHPPLVVYAGNSAAAEPVRKAIGSATTVEVTDNLLPLPNQPRIEPTRSLLRRHYMETLVPRLPGADRLKSLRCKRLGSTVEDQGLMVRYLAQRFGRNVLALTADGTTTSCLLASEGHYSEAIFGRLGHRLGALAVLEQRGHAAIQRWLPFEIGETELRNRLLNRLLRPRQIAADLDDLLLDYALLREALGMAYGALRDERPGAQFDLVLAGGALAAAPRPGLALLLLLDALQPTHKDSALALNVYLDQWSLLAASGALAHLNADAAACLLEQDALNNTPLATVIVPRGELAAGKKIAEVELKPTNGPAVTRAVHAGEIVRLPLAKGKRATLRIRPVGGIAIGQNQPGTEVLSDEAAIMGSALGVVLDARPRPLTLPDDTQQRAAQLTAWMDALDALPPRTAFAANGNGTAAPEAVVPQSTSAPVPQEEPAAALGPDATVAALREGLVLTPQPKKGLFRRK